MRTEREKKKKKRNEIHWLEKKEWEKKRNGEKFRNENVALVWIRWTEYQVEIIETEFEQVEGFLQFSPDRKRERKKRMRKKERNVSPAMSQVSTISLGSFFSMLVPFLPFVFPRENFPSSTLISSSSLSSSFFFSSFSHVSQDLNFYFPSFWSSFLTCHLSPFTMGERRKRINEMNEWKNEHFKSFLKLLP